MKPTIHTISTWKVCRRLSRRDNTLLTVGFSLRTGNRYSTSKSRKGAGPLVGKAFGVHQQGGLPPSGQITKCRPMRDFGGYEGLSYP
jgi:hypothetical protein